MFVFVLWLPLLLFTFQDIPTALCCKQIDSFWSIPTCLHAPMSLHHCIHSTMYTTCSTSFWNQGLKCKSQRYCGNMPSQGSTKSHANSLCEEKGTCSPPAVCNTHRLPQNASPSCTQQKVQTHRLFKSSVGGPLIQSGNARLCWTAGKKVYILLYLCPVLKYFCAFMYLGFGYQHVRVRSPSAVLNILEALRPLTAFMLS